MIVTRSPLRLTFGGGGTDLPSYYREHEGFLVAAAIDKFVYITIHDTFGGETILKYSQMEKVRSVSEIQHRILREALQTCATDQPALEICSMADIPAGTGLGSSGSFTTALLKGLHQHNKINLPPRDLAEQACHLEIERLGEPIGKQDQYIAAFGGITAFTFRHDGTVDVNPLPLSDDTRHALEDNLLLFFTGFSRSASSVLKDQDDKTRGSHSSTLANLHRVKELGFLSREVLRRGDLTAFAALLDEQWEMKRARSGATTNDSIDRWHSLGRAHGAMGGKLVGAGGGGFLLFYAEDKQRLRQVMRAEGLREVRFRFDYEGTKTVIAP